MPGLILERHEITSFFTRLRMASKSWEKTWDRIPCSAGHLKPPTHIALEKRQFGLLRMLTHCRVKCVTTPDGAVVNSRLRRHSLSERLARTGLLVLPCPTLIAFFTWATPLRYMEMRGS
jgi:hypothetical protein